MLGSPGMSMVTSSLMPGKALVDQLLASFQSVPLPPPSQLTAASRRRGSRAAATGAGRYRPRRWGRKAGVGRNVIDGTMSIPFADLAEPDGWRQAEVSSVGRILRYAGGRS